MGAVSDQAELGEKGSTRCVVTGGCGFIGVNLARTLRAAGIAPTAFDNLSEGSIEDGDSAGFEEVREADVRDRAALDEALAGAECVIHLAAQTSVMASIENPRNDLDVNVFGTLTVLEAARDAGVRRVIIASSSAPLGNNEPPVHEGLPTRPVSPYGASKAAGEALCSAFTGSYGLSTLALRFSNVYGPFSYHKGSVVARFLKDIEATGSITVYGDGEQTRDLVYVDDLCRGIVQALRAPGVTGVLHLASGVETTINELVGILGEELGRPFDVIHEAERVGEIRRSCSDLTLAREVLGYRAPTDLRAGLRETIAWFQAAGA